MYIRFNLDESDVETEGTEDQQDLGHQSFESIPSAYTNGTSSPAPPCELLSIYYFFIEILSKYRCLELVYSSQIVIFKWHIKCLLFCFEITYLAIK